MTHKKTRAPNVKTVTFDHVESQKHLLKPSKHNPKPVRVPPPISGLSSHHFQQRHVASMIGLPFRGKHSMAMRLKRYLEFFHGARVEIFSLNEYLGSGGSDRLLAALDAFFAAGDKEGHNAGRFAILFPDDTVRAAESRWSATSKGARRWMARTLERELQASVCFIEIKSDDSSELAEYIDGVVESRPGLTTDDVNRMVKEYEEIFVTIQDDGTEDDLAYMQLINYNQKVVVNNMMAGFLGSRMAHFLGSVHPYRHTIFLSRHGESQYNALKKIGGDSGLSPLGCRYALRLAEFAELVVAGSAEDFQCIDLGASDVQALASLLEAGCGDDEEPAIFSCGNWRDLGGPRCHVKEGMRLVRMMSHSPQQRHVAFVEVPPTVEALLDAVGSDPVSLVFVDADADTSVQVPARLMTSSLRRTGQTASHIRHPKLELEHTYGRKHTWEQFQHKINRNLDEIYAGECEGLTYEDIKRLHPDEADLRKFDKLGYRYPRGESYYDIIARLDDVIKVETFREPALIVSHQAVLRLLYAYLVGIPKDQALDMEIPLHTVIKLEFDGTATASSQNSYSRGVRETRYFLGPTYTDDGQKFL